MLAAMTTLRTCFIAWAFLLAAPIASARVIDDFTVGPISLTNTRDAGYVRQTQTGLDPAHVIGGVRDWTYDVRDNFSDPAAPDAGVRMGVAPPAAAGEPDKFFYDADIRVTAVNFRLIYDAGNSAAGLALDMLLLGHNAIAIDVLASNFEANRGHLDIMVDSAQSVQNRYKFMPLPNSATPYRVVMPLFTSTQPTPQSIKRLVLGTGNGVLFGDFELGGIKTVNTADFNSDGVVDGADFLVWQRDAGSTAVANSNSTGDADLNGVVNNLDLNLWRLANRSGDAGVHSAPEPTCGALFALAASVALPLLRRRSFS